MSGINKVILVGNLGKDPEVRELDGGIVVAKFPLATSETFKNKEGTRVDQTEWHNIVLWRGLAEVAERFLRKGSLVYIEGKLKTRSWDDKEGNKKYITEVVADNLTILSKRYKEGDENANTSDDASLKGDGNSKNSDTNQ
ncbi:MAG: single-stranded DNA-binding protein [Bacteroidia bacterium]|nr:single-stranded DNA-binding protein [Bacteroidia bacterium]